MRKILILSIAFSLVSAFSFAKGTQPKKAVNKQATSTEDEASASSSSFKITGSLIFGKEIFYSVRPGAPGKINSSISQHSIYKSGLFGTERATNMAGVEGRLFITDAIAVKLSGGAIIYHRPERQHVEGYNPGLGKESIIPYVQSVQRQTRVAITTTLGGEYHFTKKNLSPYVGLGLPFYYGRSTEYDPTFRVLNNGKVEFEDVGERNTVQMGFGANLLAGVDYYFKSNFYIGFEIKPFSLLYFYNTVYPAPGLPVAKGDMFSYGVFSQPYFKMGFVF